jgi:predicted transcriptional regulator
MATRDKYNFTQQTDLWGTIKYSNVPSYGSTSVGTTGNAYLVRSFLKEFFPFLDLSVKKTAGGSVNVKIQNYRVKFNFVENGVDKEFILDSRSLERVLEPLFEGQGFDGMTDSTYSIPLPKMYNDDGQDVSYGYGYLFVGNENTDGLYNVNLDDSLKPTAQGRKYKFKVAYISNIGLKDKILEIPEKTIQYIKTKVAINSAVIPQGIYPTPTQTNQSDLVTLEKSQPISTMTLTSAQREMVDYLALVGIVSIETIVKNYTMATAEGIGNILDDLIKMGLVNADYNNPSPLFYLTESGYDLILEQSIIDFLAEVQNIMNVSMSDFYNKFLTYDEAVIVDKIDNLVDNGVITRAKLYNGDTVYYLSETGLTLVTPTDKRSVDEIALLTQEPTETTTAGEFLTFEFINKNLAIFNDMALNAPELLNALGKGIQLVQKLAANSTGELLPFVPLENQQQIEDQLKEEDFDLSEVDLEELDLSGLEDDLELNDDELGDLDLTEFNELADFVENELMPSTKLTPTTAPNSSEVKLLPSQYNVLKVLYDNYKKYPVANEMNSESILIVLKQDNIIYGNNQILKYLEELSDFEFVLQDNDFKGNISWIITPEGVDFFEKLPKTKTVGQVREEQRQEKAQKTGDGLDYDYYLIASILNQSVNMMITAGDVTAILQQQFKKNPKWDETEILLKLRVLTSLGMALLDIQNSVEYFEISEFGEDVVKYLIEQENKGLYPKSKPTQQTVASRPSPTESATLNPIGTIKQGNDGNNWQVRENKSGVKRWVKL